MERTTAVWPLLVGGSVALLSFSVVSPVVLGLAGNGTSLLVAAVLGVLAGVGALLAARRGDSESEANDVWDAIPGWQYDGRHVESGGFTRGEQEDAIEDVQETASKKLDQLDDQH